MWTCMRTARCVIKLTKYYDVATCDSLRLISIISQPRCNSSFPSSYTNWRLPICHSCSIPLSMYRPCCFFTNFSTSLQDYHVFISNSAVHTNWINPLFVLSIIAACITPLPTARLHGPLVGSARGAFLPRRVFLGCRREQGSRKPRELIAVFCFSAAACISPLRHSWNNLYSPFLFFLVSFLSPSVRHVNNWFSV
jgi:hypothetical protein